MGDLLATPQRRRLAIAGAATAASIALVGALIAVASAGGSSAATPGAAAAGATGMTGMAGMTGPSAESGGTTGSPGPSGIPSTSGATSGAATVPTPVVDTAGFPSGPRQPGIFTDRCGYSHEAADDPILAPGQPGAAMHHDFYGNTTTSAASTAAGLVGGPSTCSTTADSSAYWTPVMYQNGVALTPGPALIYWRRPAGDQDAVQAVPAGLQIIAGDETATAPQSTSVIDWICADDLGTRPATGTPHNCPGSQLRLVVMFPSCWDGHTLTGAGQEDVVYRTASGCPSSHPVQIPQVVFHVNYPTASAAGLTLSMTPTMQGSTDTEHVDFVNGWQQNMLTADVAACDATSTRCGPVTGPQATPHGPVTR